MKFFRNKKAVNDASKIDFLVKKSFFSLNGQYLYITNVTRKLYSLEIGLKLIHFKQIFLNNGKNIWKSFTIVQITNERALK